MLGMNGGVVHRRNKKEGGEIKIARRADKETA